MVAYATAEKGQLTEITLLFDLPIQLQDIYIAVKHKRQIKTKLRRVTLL